MKRAACCLVLAGLAAPALRAAVPPEVEAANIKKLRESAAVELVVKVLSVKPAPADGGGYCARVRVKSVKVARAGSPMLKARPPRKKGEIVSVKLDCQPDGRPPAPGQAARPPCSAAVKAKLIRLWSSYTDFPSRDAGGCPGPDAGMEIAE